PPRNKACFLYARSRCPHRSFTVGGRIDDFNGRIKQNNDKQGKPRPPKHEKEVGMAIQPLSQPIIQPIDHEYSLPPSITYHPPEKERSFPVPSLSSPRALFQQKNRVAWEAQSPTRSCPHHGAEAIPPRHPLFRLNHKLHPPVLLPVGLRVVGNQRLPFPVALRRQHRRRHAEPVDQRLSHRLRPA